MFWQQITQHAGFAFPFALAAATYSLFIFLDRNASPAAKTALLAFLKREPYKVEDLRSAIIAMFDSVYGAPLGSFTAFKRILYISVTVGVLWLVYTGQALFLSKMIMKGIFVSFGIGRLVGSVLTVFLSDYISVFAIRHALTRFSSGVVNNLMFGLFAGVLCIFATTLIFVVFLDVFTSIDEGKLSLVIDYFSALSFFWGPNGPLLPAMLVHIWLATFTAAALCLRLLPSLQRAMWRAIWFLKRGRQHPFQAVGLLAAVLTFLGSTIAHFVFL
jgi:hypothetical protein